MNKIKGNISLSEAIKVAMKHDNRSKYAKKHVGRESISGTLTDTVTLDDSVEALVYTGEVTYGKNGIVDTNKNPLSHKGNYQPVSFDCETRVIKQAWITDETLIGVVGKSPRYDIAPVNNRYTYTGIIRQPFIGKNPLPSEERRSRYDVKAIARINRWLERRQSTTTIRPKEINGTLPCWQSRSTFGEAEPFVADTNQCSSCALTVQGYRDEYCDDAIAKSKTRMLNSRLQTELMFGDSTSKQLQRLEQDLADVNWCVEREIQERYDIECKSTEAYNEHTISDTFGKLDKPKFMKFKKSIISEYSHYFEKIDLAKKLLEDVRVIEKVVASNRKNNKKQLIHS